MSSLKKSGENTSNHVNSLVAIVGRPNTGKSTLFNRIIEQRKAIVEDTPGVTRDRIYGQCQWDGQQFRLVDTGGFQPQSIEPYPKLIRNQIDIAIGEADLIIFLLDGKTGLMPQDKEILNLLRKTEKPVLYVVNKVDHESHEKSAFDFHRLGIQELITISALHGRNIGELLDRMTENLPGKRGPTQVEEENIIKVAVIGKPNVGKSTLANRILGEERFITSPIPGTTRDSVDTYIESGDRKYILIDTAGIRRKSKIELSLEKYSVQRAISAMERADVVLFMVDSEGGPTHQDARLAQLIRDRGRACIILLNKWDLVPPEIAATPGIEEIVRDRLKAVDFAPVLIISALTGRGVDRVFPTVDLVYENFSRRIRTKALNNLLQEIVVKNPPPMHGGRRIKFYYISQPMTEQPTFVIFTNSASGVPESYKRFLENVFREVFPLEGTPIKFRFRERRKKS